MSATQRDTITGWEWLNIGSLVAGVAVLIFLLGLSMPRSEAAQQPLPAQPTAAAPAAQAASDWQPSEPEPSGIRGLTVDELLEDAWSAYSTLPASPAPSGQWTAVPEYTASYDGALPDFPAGYFSIQSSQHPGVSHVFHMAAAQRA